MLRLLPAACVLVALCPVLGGPVPPALAQAGWVVIATGLDNPRGLAMDSDGSIVVAEAGRGGTDPCIVVLGELNCYGTTGAVGRIAGGVYRRVMEGLPSLAPVGGNAANGPNDVATNGKKLYVAIGMGIGIADRDLFGVRGQLFGQVLRVLPHGGWQIQGDVGAFEHASNPDGGAVESNPFGLHGDRGELLVADAAGNTLLSVSGGGRVSTLVVFPNRLVPGPAGDVLMQPVPTAVVRGHDGAFYISELTGFPFPVGGARIYRWAPGAAVAVFAEGFTNLIDLSVGPDGSLYALEFATNGLLSGDPTGRLVRIAKDGTRTTAAAGLVAPTAVLAAADGRVYVTNYGVMAGLGEVVRLAP